MGGIIPVVSDILSAIFSNKIVAYFVVLGVLLLDSLLVNILAGGLISDLGVPFSGVLSFAISMVLQTLFNNPNIWVSNIQLIIVIGILPVAKYIWEHSGH